MVNCNYIIKDSQCKNKINFYNDYKPGYFITCHKHRCCIICKVKINQTEELCQHHCDVLTNFIINNNLKINLNDLFFYYNIDNVNDIINGNEDMIKSIIYKYKDDTKVNNNIFILSFN